MKYYVKLVNNGQEYWLRGTAWTFVIDRAFMYDTREEADAALIAAKPFTKPALRKLMTVKEFF